MFSEHVYSGFARRGRCARGNPNEERPVPKEPQTPDEQGEIRPRVLHVAREVYDTEGYAAVTMRNVARRSGYSPAAFYRYFSSHLEHVRSMWQDAVAKELLLEQ